jgi:hypothetical protein
MNVATEIGADIVGYLYEFVFGASTLRLLVGNAYVSQNVFTFRETG